MSDITGIWAIQIDTPMGAQRFKLDLVDDNAKLSGIATNNAGSYQLSSGSVGDNHLSFAFEVTTPFPLSLTFELDLDAEGKTLSGESKAGPFPPSKVTGQRE